MHPLSGLKACLATVLLPLGAAAAPTYTPNDFKDAAQRCIRARDLNCAEFNWAAYVRMRPTDASGIGQYAVVLARREKYAEALPLFEKAIDLGEGHYELFALHALTLDRLGRLDESIDWNYKALAVVPSLVDVRGDLARQLVRKKRFHEALALLASFDSQLAAKGHGAYFEGQRIAIETALQRDGGADSAEAAALRLPRFEGHFFAPVTLGDARPQAFMVDTGATHTVMSENLLAGAKAAHRLLRADIVLRAADGSPIKARLVSLGRLSVGPFELHDVSVVVCKTCELLLGQSTLARFDLASRRRQGVEFLSLAPRPVSAAPAARP